MLSHAFVRAKLAEPVFGNTHGPPAARARAQKVLAYHNCQARRKWQPQNARAFERFGRARRPTVLSGFYPQFHSKCWGCPPAQLSPAYANTWSHFKRKTK